MTCVSVVLKRTKVVVWASPVRIDRCCYGKEFYCFLEFHVSMPIRSPAPLVQI